MIQVSSINKVTITQNPLYNARALFSISVRLSKEFLNAQSAVIFRKISFASRNLENKALFLI